MLVEAEGSDLGWTAAARERRARPPPGRAEGPSLLPVTLLWFTNGGRDYAPWNGRHIGVLGIEDARCCSLYGHRASIEPNPLCPTPASRPAFALTPDGEVEVRHVIGAFAAPYGWQGTRAITETAGRLHVESAAGDRLDLPFDGGFLGPRA